MKTIEEGALDHIHDTVGEFLHKDQSFKAGVEFAQRWIPIEEELPDRYYVQVIVRDEVGNWDKAIYSGLGWKFTNDNSEVGVITHWRPVYRK